MSASPLNVQTIDELVQAAAEQERFYSGFLVDGPLKSIGGERSPAQLAGTIRFLRSGDCTVTALQALPTHHKIDSAIHGLAIAMLAVAGRGVMHERPEHIVSEQHAQRVVTDLTQYDPSRPGVLTESMITGMLGMTSQNRFMWQPIKEVVQLLVSMDETAELSRFIRKLDSVGDDNDLACIVGNMTSRFMDRFKRGDTSAGDLAYRLAQQDNAIMGSRLDVSRNDYLGVQSERPAAIAGATLR